MVAIDTTVDDGAIIRCLKKDPTQNEEEALKDIYKRMRPGEPPTTANAKALLKRLFQDPSRYDLGRVGRYKLNQKLKMDTDLNIRVIDTDDVVEATKYLCRLKGGDGTLTTSTTWAAVVSVQLVSLLANQCRTGLARTERLVKGAHDSLRSKRRHDFATEAD